MLCVRCRSSLVVILAVVCALGLSKRLAAQSSDEAPTWEAMRIYMPESLDNVVPRDYLTFPLSELETLLAGDARRRQQSAGQAAGIQRAVYVARWSDQLLVSNASLWQTSMPGNAGPLNIGRTSLALDDPFGLSGDLQPLTRHLRYADDNRLQIAGGEGQQNYWFSFRSKARRRDSGQQSLELTLPRALLATMLIAVPAEATITANLPCVRIDSPAKFLPTDWPASAIPAPIANEHWYVLLLSGRQTCTLNYSPPRQTSQNPYRLSVASAQCDVLVQPAGLQTTARFQLANPPASGTLRVLVEDPLHVRSIQLNGTESTNWISLPEDTSQSKTSTGNSMQPERYRLIEIPCDGVGDGPMAVNVDTIARMSLPFEGSLPRIEVVDAFVLDGRCTFASQDNVQIEDVRTSALRLTTNSPSNATAPNWQWQWTGKTPKVITRLRTNTNQWTVRSLTRFNLQKDVVVATAHININSSNVQGNQVTLKLANGWFVDSVQAENAPLGVSAEVRETGKDTSELSVRWEERRSDLDVRVIINAHYHQRTEVDDLRLQSTRIATLPGADQQDTYVMEQSGRFQLVVDPELLRMRVGEDELPTWQRALLPRLGDAWIFRSGRSNLPVVRMERIRATLETRLHTTIRIEEKDFLVTYRVACHPISGSIDQLRIMLPIPPDAVAPQWNLVPRFDGTTPKGLQVYSRATSSSSGETAFTVALSQDISEEFQIEAELRVPLETNHRVDDSDPATELVQATSQAMIPLPSIPQAVAQDAIVVLPMGYQFPLDGSSLEILPNGLCCADGELVDAGGDIARVVTARYDPNNMTHLSLRHSPNRTDGAWAHRQLHQHWQHTNGRAAHRSSWLITAAEPTSIEIKLPLGWQVDALHIDGKATVADTTTAQVVRIRIPSGQRTRLDLECSSIDRSTWSPWRTYEAPDLGLPAHQSQHIVWFPAQVMAGQALPETQAATWQERLWPKHWWRLLSLNRWHQPSPWRAPPAVNLDDRQPEFAGDTNPAFTQLDPHLPDQASWWPLQLRNSEAAESSTAVWSVEVSRVACLTLTVALILAAVFVMTCGQSVWRWCCCWMITVGLLLVVQSWFLPAIQLVALGLTAGSLLKFSQLLIRVSRPPARKHGDSVHAVLKPLLSRTSTTVLILACYTVVSLTGTVSAQPFNRNAARDRQEIFGILIPVDSENKIAGDLVYVPTRLYSLLNNSKQQDTKNGSVTVSAAFYSLSVLNDPVTLTSSIGEITAELNVQANRADAELRLPFDKEELALQRAYVDSNSLTLGERIRQDGNQLIWRAIDTDRHGLRLVFKPRSISMKDGRGTLSVTIPAIPTAKLDVMGDDLRDVTVEAIGGTQLDSPRSLVARLGPMNKLSISWPLLLGRSSAVQVQSDTWLHTRGDQIMAMCQLRVRGAAALPSALHVVGDTNWMPVGQDWEDFRLLSTDGVTSSGRPVYTVERSQDGSNEQLVLRMLMLPKSEAAPQSLPMPFLSFQEVAAVGRSLAFSHGESQTWRSTGTETWQPLLASQTSQIWDKARLSDQPTLFKVPTGSLMAMLSRNPAPPAVTVNEVTEISLQSPETKVKYSARWSQPLTGKPTIRLHVPANLRVDGAFVDASPARFNLHKVPVQPGQPDSGIQELNVMVDGNLGGLHSIHLQLSTPVRLNKPWKLSRPLLLEHKIESSVLQVFRGAELQSELRVTDQANFELERVDLRPSPLLLNLHSLIGQLDLQDRIRDTVELPVEVRLAKAPAARRAQAVMRLLRSDQGWRAQLDAYVDVAPGETNHLFIDLPRSLESSIREPVDANAPMMLWPSADSNRAILCVLPSSHSGSRSHVTLTFRLPTAGASQSINVPDIRFLGLSIDRPILALPKTIAGQDVRWSQVGRPLNSETLEPNTFSDQELSAYSLHEPGGSQLQATWLASEGEEQGARVLMTRIALAKDQLPHSVRAHIAYWIEPRNQAYLSIKLPKNCQLTGVMSGTQPMPWTKSGDDQIRILMQPSYLPLRLHLFVKWTDPASFSPSEMQLPLPGLSARNAGAMWAGLDERSPLTAIEPLWQFPTAVRLDAESLDEELAQTWAKTLIDSAPTAADRNDDELLAWLPEWDPSALGLNGATTITIPAQFLSRKTAVGADDNPQITVAEFWQELQTRHWPVQPTGPAVARTAADRDHHEAELQVNQWYRLPESSSVTQLSIRALPANLEIADSRQTAWTLAAILAMLTIVIIARSWLLKGLTALAELVWPLWLSLALACALLLPVIWPSVLLIACTLVVIFRRHREMRRDRQFIFRPKPAR